MMIFTPEETAACRRLVQWALREDLEPSGDLTSQATIPADLWGEAVFSARSPGVLAGLPAVDLVLAAVEVRLQLQPDRADGSPLRRSDPIARLSGPMRAILAAERTALNFLQRLSGVATLTRQYVDAVAGLPCRILDTRKTTPGWRLLEKYAVRCGGGHNHRIGLHDGILIKDNHLAALRNPQAGARDEIEEAIRRCRQLHPTVPVEIEVDSLEQLERALACQPDMVLLDNMPLDELRQAVVLRHEKAATVRLEASGGVNLTTVRAIAETGVDRISVGALTHSAPALDIGLDYSEDRR